MKIQTFTPTNELKALMEVYGNIEYEDNKKAIINLQNDKKNAKIYLQLAEEMKRLDAAEKEVKEMKAKIKEASKIYIADLFKAEDTIMTRVVKTVNAIFTLTKDPKPTVTVQYSKVLEEFEKHLTPELREVLESLKKKYEKVSPRAPSLKVADTLPEFMIHEPIEPDLLQEFSVFLDDVNVWAYDYDQKFNDLMNSI